MIWLFLLSLFILFFTPPRFRLPVLGILILFALGGFLLSQPGEETTAELRSRIPSEQVEIIQVDLHRSRGVGRELTGKVLNHSSSYTLTGLGIQLVIKDCVNGNEESQQGCAVLEKVSTHLLLSVPPGAEEEFNKRLYFRELHLQGRMQWEYIVLYTEARGKRFWEKILED